MYHDRQLTLCDLPGSSCWTAEIWSELGCRWEAGKWWQFTGVELCPGEEEVSFFYQMERSEETDNSVITSAVIRGTGRSLPIRICGLLGGSVRLIRNPKRLCLNTVSSFCYLSLFFLAPWLILFILSFLILSDLLLRDQWTCRSLHINRRRFAVSSAHELSPLILTHVDLTLSFEPLKSCFIYTVSEENKDQCCILIDNSSFCYFIMFNFQTNVMQKKIPLSYESCLIPQFILVCPH